LEKDPLGGLFGFDRLGVAFIAEMERFFVKSLLRLSGWT
jgi:hypothetical protein